MFKYFKFSVVLLMGAFLLSGCSMSEKLRWLDDQAGRLFDDAQSGEQKIFIATSSQEWIDLVKNKAVSLTIDQKDYIDKFLAENNLNRFGDATSTVYASGTPLFDKVTGESVDRFEYILKNHPEILEKIKNGF
ncbi:MAG: hypothetical protein BWY51_00745 [Parcubacteria group bacterium ADurb.Bin316]|nr:MAG: hypothetical protein BWY51_00745 [Parcubacteria group bacterium ADurb.Bin316]